MSAARRIRSNTSGNRRATWRLNCRRHASIHRKAISPGRIETTRLRATQARPRAPRCRTLTSGIQRGLKGWRLRRPKNIVCTSAASQQHGHRRRCLLLYLLKRTVVQQCHNINVAAARISRGHVLPTACNCCSGRLLAVSCHHGHRLSYQLVVSPLQQCRCLDSAVPRVSAAPAIVSTDDTSSLSEGAAHRDQLKAHHRSHQLPPAFQCRSHMAARANIELARQCIAI